MNQYIGKKQKRLPTPGIGSRIKLTFNEGAQIDKRQKYKDCDFNVPWVVFSIGAKYFMVRHPNHGTKDYKRPDGTTEPNERTIPLSRYGNSKHSGVFWDIDPDQVTEWIHSKDAKPQFNRIPAGMPAGDYE